MPVRVTTVHDAGYDARADMAHFDEDRYAHRASGSQRLLTDHAWTEDPRVADPPPRHQRAHVRRRPAARSSVESTLLLFRSRGDDRDAGVRVRPAPRRAAPRDGAGAWPPSPHITVEESVLRTQNLAIFL